MKHGGIIAAAIEVLADIESRHRPANEALRDWGLAHRFAGSGDRAILGNLVFDALRRRASIAWRMGSDTPRALAVGAYAFAWGYDIEHIEVAFASDRHAPEALSDSERVAVRTATLDGAPAHVVGDYPEWLAGSLEGLFGAAAVAEGRALAGRAPVDLRVNTLKVARDKVIKALERFDPAPTPISPVGLRLEAGAGPARAPHVVAEAGAAKGWYEVQDEGSQLAALMAGPAPGLQVADLCAGAGGKTLALAAGMENTGQIYAWDADRRRLAAIHPRLQRAGARNVQVRQAGDAAALSDLTDRMDVVLIDAPCTGSGAWRRRPDAKWRVSEAALAERAAEQIRALKAGAALVKPGGRVVYVTCSLLPEENEEQVAGFVTAHPEFVPAAPGDVIAATLPEAAAAKLAEAALARPTGLMLTPRRTGTDGFFVGVMTRRRA